MCTSCSAPGGQQDSGSSIDRLRGGGQALPAEPRGGVLMSWPPTTVVWESLERRLPVDWCRALLRGGRWPELSVDESVRVSLEMDGSRPGGGERLRLLPRSGWRG